MTDHDTRLEIDDVIDEAKHEIRNLFGKSKELIKKIGDAFKRSGFKEESICELIKNALKDEITDGLISSRSIELHCPPEWKRKTKPKNEKPSFSSSSDKIPQPQLAATSEGISVIINEPTNNEDSDTGEPDRSIDHSQSPISEERILGHDQDEHDIDGILQGTQPTTKEGENFTGNLSSQVQQESAHQQIVEFDFLILFEDLRLAMAKLYGRTKGFGKMTFHGILNTTTNKVTVTFCGNSQGEFFSCEGKGTILKSNTLR